MHLHQHANVSLSNSLCQLACAEPCSSTLWAAAGLIISVFDKKKDVAIKMAVTPILSKTPGRQTCPGLQTELCTNESDITGGTIQPTTEYIIDMLQKKLFISGEMQLVKLCERLFSRQLS